MFLWQVWRNTALGNLCRTSEASTTSYGVDPVLLTTSSLYSLEVQRARTDYYNYTNPLEVSENTTLPHGFIHRAFDGDEGFYAFIDINLSQTQAKKYVQYLIDGFFIDGMTDTIEVLMLLYNPYYGNNVM